MLQRWLPIANCYLRSREEDYVSALILSVGLGLSAAGTIACALRPCGDLIAHIAAVSYPATVALMSALAIVYYVGWGSWIRRRLRQPLRSMALLCCIGACAPISLGSGAPELLGGVLMLFLCAISLWAALKRKVTSPTGSTAGLIWTVAFMIASVLFVVVRWEYISWSIFAAPGALLSLGVIAYCIPYRPWAHAVWHVFMIAAACTHYAVVWQHLM